MNYVDVFIVVVLVAATAHGMMQGAAVQVLSFASFWAGFAAGVVLAPVVGGLVQDPLWRAAASLITVFGTAAVVGGVGREFGFGAWKTLRRLRLGALDALAGSVVAAVATILAVWLIGGILAAVPLPGVSTGVQESRIFRSVTSTLPPAPPVVAGISRLLYAAGFPPAFAELEPSPPDVGLPADPEVARAASAARSPTVRVVRFGCGGQLTGSGFVAAPGLVVTNAHVVAGIDAPAVEDRRGHHRATTVLWDAGADIAVLRASDLAGRPLPLLRSPLRAGAGGAVLGYPGGGPLRAGPAAVRQRFPDALGRDIYNRATTTRDVYQLHAEVRSGNSGGPFVLPSGDVAGVVFSRSALRPDIGYAVTSLQVDGLLDQARARQAAVDTGPCAA